MDYYLLIYCKVEEDGSSIIGLEKSAVKVPALRNLE